MKKEKDVRDKAIEILASLKALPTTAQRVDAFALAATALIQTGAELAGICKFCESPRLRNLGNWDLYPRGQFECPSCGKTQSS